MNSQFNQHRIHRIFVKHPRYPLMIFTNIPRLFTKLRGTCGPEKTLKEKFVTDDFSKSLKSCWKKPLHNKTNFTPLTCALHYYTTQNSFCLKKGFKTGPLIKNFGKKLVKNLRTVAFGTPGTIIAFLDRQNVWAPHGSRLKIIHTNCYYVFKKITQRKSHSAL